MARLDDMEYSLNERLDQLEKKKTETSETNGNISSDDTDLIEVNAGGKIISAKRSTLTQLKGTRFEALFSGRWDKELQRDDRGRIFLDVNPVGFRAIVDYLNEVAISSEEDLPDKPSAKNDEHKLVLQHQLELFGLFDNIGPIMGRMPDSNILKDGDHVDRLHDWLEEDGSDGEFNLLYRFSRDGTSAASFHSKCDNRGCTLTVIETTDGYVLGGYSNTPWKSTYAYRAADKAFLFVLSGNDIASPCKMKLKKANDHSAVLHRSSCGPSFGEGDDLCVPGSGSSVGLRFGKSYESGPSQLDNGEFHKVMTIKEMEVFQVSEASSWTGTATTNEKQSQSRRHQVEPVTRFSKDVNEAINAKQESLQRAEAEVLHLEDSFKDEHHFITNFANGDTKDVVVLNVSGTIMATNRSTLQIAEDSVLAQQFDDSKWKQGNTSCVKDWTPDDVRSWAYSIDNIPDEVANVFVENEIKGNELLALGIEGLKVIGIHRTGTVYLLSKEIEKLERDSLDAVTLIEHSPYCFGKILDYLRWKQLQSRGLSKQPPLPKVCDVQKSRFEKVVRYYFPGDSAKFILG